jgi:hypothetical protein
MKAAPTDAADRTLHPLLEALEAGGVAREVLALVLDDRRLRGNETLSRGRIDGVDARRDLARARASTA